MAALSDLTTLIASYDHADFPVLELRAVKRDLRISVCIPARDEAATVGPIVETVRRELVDDVGLVDELLVVDDGSKDAPRGRLCRRRPHRLRPRDRRLAGHAERPAGGKGEAMRRGFAASSGGSSCSSTPMSRIQAHFVTGLLGPLCCGRRRCS